MLNETAFGTSVPKVVPSNTSYNNSVAFTRSKIRIGSDRPRGKRPETGYRRKLCLKARKMRPGKLNLRTAAAMVSNNEQRYRNALSALQTKTLWFHFLDGNRRFGSSHEKKFCNKKNDNLFVSFVL